MPPDHMIPKHDFNSRPDPEREMEVEFMIKLPVFGRTKQVTQTCNEIERYVRLHVSPEARVAVKSMRDKSKTLPDPPVTGNGTHPDLPF